MGSRLAPSLLPPHAAVLGGAVAAAAPCDLRSVSTLLYYSFALSGEKDAMSRVVQPRSAWSKRSNASSGGLHPEEVHLLWRPPGSAAPQVLHYSCRDHALESRHTIPADAWAALTAGLPDGAFLLAISCRAWREVWKYGERGLRYTHLDLGHALGALAYAAAMLGWKIAPLTGVSGTAADRFAIGRLAHAAAR